MKVKSLKNIKYLIIILPLLILSFCCEDNDEIVYKEAVLTWSGDYAVDGCGFFIEMDNKSYKADNEEIIGNEYKVNDSSKVKIRFWYLNQKIKYLCGDFHAYKEIDGIKIYSIVKL